MLNKDKRSLVLSLILGDGCLHYIKNSGKIFGGLTIAHAPKQGDYLSWKAKLLSDIFNRKVVVRGQADRDILQISVCVKRLRSWRKFCYPKNKKSIPKILKFIKHPEMALAIWLMDDGYVENSISKLANDSKKNYGARFRIFTCDQSEQEHSEMIKWFKDTFSVEAKVKQQRNNKKDKSYPFLKFGQADSLILWEKIREFVLQFKSMQHKFRYIEQIYQSRISQRKLGSQ